MKALFALLLLAAPAAGGPIEEGDALFTDRGDAARVDRAIGVWEAVPEGPERYAARWRLAWAYYARARPLKDKAERLKLLRKAAAAGEEAVRLEPKRPEGHFWLGVAYGRLAEDSGAFKSLSLIGPIREHFEAAKAIDPGYLKGGADRALGRYYQKLPRVLGGSPKTALEHLEAALARDPEDTLTHLYLGDLHAAQGRKEEARRHYEKLLALPVRAEWKSEDAANQERARSALQKMGTVTD